jgi:hypothetical protein
VPQKALQIQSGPSDWSSLVLALLLQWSLVALHIAHFVKPGRFALLVVKSWHRMVSSWGSCQTSASVSMDDCPEWPKFDRMCRNAENEKGWDYLQKRTKASNPAAYTSKDCTAPAYFLTLLKGEKDYHHPR